MKTKELTFGAMLLAIISAILLLDKSTGFLLADMSPIIVVSSIIYYARHFSFKNSLLLSFGILVIGFLFGNTTSYVYIPLGVLTGVVFAALNSKLKTAKSKILTLFSLFAISEIIVSFIIYPLLFSMPLAMQVEGSVAILTSLGVQGGPSLVISIIALVLMIGVIAIVETLLTVTLVSSLIKRFKPI